MNPAVGEVHCGEEQHGGHGAEAECGEGLQVTGSWTIVTKDAVTLEATSRGDQALSR